MKVFIAHYRYPDTDGIGPADYFVDVEADSFKKAKAIAKSYEGRDDRMKWFMGITKVERGE